MDNHTYTSHIFQPLICWRFASHFFLLFFHSFFLSFFLPAPHSHASFLQTHHCEKTTLAASLPIWDTSHTCFEVIFPIPYLQVIIDRYIFFSSCARRRHYHDVLFSVPGLFLAFSRLLLFFSSLSFPFKSHGYDNLSRSRINWFDGLRAIYMTWIALFLFFSFKLPVNSSVDIFPSLEERSQGGLGVGRAKEIQLSAHAYINSIYRKLLKWVAMNRKEQRCLCWPPYTFIYNMMRKNKSSQANGGKRTSLNASLCSNLKYSNAFQCQSNQLLR